MKKTGRLQLRRERLAELTPDDLVAIAGGRAQPETLSTCLSRLFTNTWSCGGPPDTQLCVATN
jgi:hypothetical protein